MTPTFTLVLRILAVCLFVVDALVVLFVTAPDPKLFPVLLLFGLASWALADIVP